MKIIEKLINEISNFVPGEAPSKIKIILEESGYSEGKYIEQNFFCSETGIEIYKLVKEVAFIMHDAVFLLAKLWLCLYC